MRTIKKRDINAIEKHLPHSESEAISMFQLAKRLRCSYMTARRRLAAWAEREKRTVKTTVVRVGERGPESVGYYAD